MMDFDDGSDGQESGLDSADEAEIFARIHHAPVEGLAAKPVSGRGSTNPSEQTTALKKSNNQGSSNDTGGNDSKTGSFKKKSSKRKLSQEYIEIYSSDDETGDGEAAGQSGTKNDPVVIAMSDDDFVLHLRQDRDLGPDVYVDSGTDSQEDEEDRESGGNPDDNGQMDGDDDDDASTCSADWDVTDDTIIRKNRQRFYEIQIPTGVMCHNCGERGHMQRDCEKPRKQFPCYTCGQRGHNSRVCPKAICYNCRIPGHSSRKCRSRRLGARETCGRCFSPGHPESLCPDLWRRYHSVVNDKTLRLFHSVDKSVCPDINLSAKKKAKPSQQGICFMCASRKHYGWECEPGRTDTDAPTPTVVAVYTSYGSRPSKAQVTTKKHGWKKHTQQQEQPNQQNVKKKHKHKHDQKRDNRDKKPIRSSGKRDKMRKESKKLKETGRRVIVTKRKKDKTSGGGFRKRSKKSQS